MEIQQTYGLNTVIDISSRERKEVLTWCAQNGVTYIKIPIDSRQPTKAMFDDVFNSITLKTLIFNFSGTGEILAIPPILSIKNGGSVEAVTFDFNFKTNFKYPQIADIIGIYAATN